MGIVRSTHNFLRPFIGGLFIGVLLMHSGLLLDRFGFVDVALNTIFAAYSGITPTGDGTVQGTQNAGCGATNASCIDGDTSTSSGPAAGSLTLGNNDQDYYIMSDLSGVSQVDAVDVGVYHQEGNGNMATYVSLWDEATESIQYGSEIQLTNRTTGQWDSAHITGTNFPMTGGELNGMVVRLRCTRPGGGKSSDCTISGMFANVDYVEQIDVTVSTTSSQVDLRRGTTSAHVGGTFVITENSGSRNIQDITITENGSVDAQNDLDNIELWYEIDNDATPNCVSESFDGDEIQFGNTDTDGFSGANGTSAFSTTTGPQISTTATMCVYVVLDVLDSAGIGDTIEIEISDPSTQVDGTGSPVVEPDTAIALGGTTTILDDDLTQISYHWRQDNGNEGDTVLGADSYSNDTSSTSIDNATKNGNFRLRLAISNEGNDAAPETSYRLEFGEKATLCSAIAENDWIDVSSTTDAWDMINSNDVTLNDGNTTNITDFTKGAIEDYNATFVGTGGFRETTSQSGSTTLDFDEFTELEYSLFAASSIVDGTTYCFRVVGNGSPLASYVSYPEITFNADVTTAIEEAQPSSVSISTATDVLLGAFVFTDSGGGGHDIDEITITASSTVADITTAFDNIELYYEIDNDATPNCASESYGGVLETLYGGQTDTDGFSANGTSTFTGGVLSTPTVSPTQAVCLYVILDATASTSDGDLLDISIANPSVDVVLDAGSVAPASLVELSGTTEFTAPNVVQEHYHWRNNDNTGETDSTSATGGLEDTILDELAQNTTARIRIGVQNKGGEAAATAQYELQWAQKVSSCDVATGWIDVDGAADEFQTVTSLLSDGSNTTDIATSTGGVSNDGYTFYAANTGQESSSQTGNITVPSNNILELEYAIQATATTTEGASYCFRVTDNGTPLDNYTAYPEVNIKLGTDFVVTRNVTTITNGATSASISEGLAGQYDLQFDDASRAFIRITNSGHTGAGPAATGNNDANDVTAYISNPGNITSGITFTRSGATGDTRIAWEVVEYIGEVGGENEIVVRSASTVTYGTGATTVTTGTVSGIVDDNDVVPWITGQGNPNAGRFDYNTGLSTSAWNSGTDDATFTRGETGSNAVNVSYAIIEFTGANWIIQRSEHTFTAAGATESDTSINPVGDETKTFLHVQKRVGSNEDQHADFGHEVYMNTTTAVRYLLDGNAQTANLHTSVAWIIENTQSSGNVMRVERSNGTIPSGGTPPTVSNLPIGKTLEDLSIASIFVTNRADGTSRNFHEPIISARLLNSSTTDYELWVGDNTDNINYRVEVVEWPTAASKLVQNYFQLYEDNDLITPSTVWSTLGENDEMTGANDPIATGENIRIRMSLNVTAAAQPAGVDAFLLQYAARPSGACSALAESEWFPLGEIGSTTALWRANDATPADGTTLPSTLLSVSDIAGTYEEENNTALTPTTAFVGDDIEFDWNIEDNGAADKTDYCFRMRYADGTSIESYTRYPVIRTVGYGPVVGDWKWFDDETNITPSTQLAGTNTAPIDIAFENIIKLRTVVSEKSGATGVDTKFKLQYSQDPTFSQSVFDVAASSTCTASSTWCYADAAGVDNAVVDDNTLATADACAAGSGNGCGTHNEGTATTTATLDQPALTNMEFEFTIEHAGARANAVYYFRLYDLQNDEVVSASSTYPSLTTEGPSLVFTISGLPSGTNTEGITTDVTTSPTAIAFGSVPIDTEYEAAQRITVDTNATQGYQILKFAQQAFLNTYAEEIADVTGTNALPTGWTTGCVVSAIGCVGYHVGDDTLDGGSTRFAADDTYAGFDTTPQEIMYSSVPANESSDIVYKIQVSETQPAGDYETEIVYMAVPVF